MGSSSRWSGATEGSRPWERGPKAAPGSHDPAADPFGNRPFPAHRSGLVSDQKPLTFRSLTDPPSLLVVDLVVALDLTAASTVDR
jgi:hypothetical protein